jgi:hypothetical protein
MPRATVARTDEAIRLRDVAIQIPATALAGALQAGALSAGGEIVLMTGSLQLGDPAGGTLAVEWRGARLAAAGELIDLGTVAGDLSVRGGTLAGPISNRDGDVRVSGEVVVGSQGSSVAVRLTPDPATPEQARRLLARLGAPSPDGSVPIRLQLQR